jgi:glycosyltransferase involved in cell wall biosynthesis
VAAASTYTARLARRLRELAPDIVHTNSLKAAYYGGLAGRLAGIPVVWHMHDQIVADHLPNTSVRITRRLAGRLPVAVVANSVSTLETLGPLRQPTAVVAPVIVDADRAAPVRRKQGPFRVGMVARLSPWKGQDVFLSAFAQAFADRDVRAVIVGGSLFGEDEYAESLRVLVAHLDLDGRVEFLGHTDDVPAVLSDLDVVVHASTAPEPFGRVIVEAMAAGVPVVASRAGGAAELVEHDVTGLLFSPGAVGELAQAMLSLERSSQLRARLAHAGLARAAEFSAKRAVDQVTDLYNRVLEGPGRCAER